MRRMTKNEKGAALISLVVILCILIVMLVTTAIILTNSVRNQVFLEERTDKAFNIAESGIELYVKALNLQPNNYKLPEKLGVLEPEELYSEAKWLNYPKSYKVFDVKKDDTLIGQFQISVVPPDLPFKETLTVYSEGWAMDNTKIKRKIRVELVDQGTVGVTPKPVLQGKNNQFVIVANTVRETDGTPIYLDEYSVFNSPVLVTDNMYFDGRTEFAEDLFINGRVVNTTPPELYTPEPTPYFANGSPISMSGYNIIQHEDLDVFFENLAVTVNPSLIFTGRTRIRFDGNKMYYCNVNTMGDEEAFLDGRKEMQIDSNAKILVLGDLWLTGKISGTKTIAATENIYISGVDVTQNFTDEAFLYNSSNIVKTNGIRYNNPNTDILFIYGYRNVYVHTNKFPKPGGTGTRGELYDVNGHYFLSNGMDIHGSIYAPNGSFKLQDFPQLAHSNDVGLITNGTLNFFGSAAVYYLGTFYWHDGYAGKPNVLGYRFNATFDDRLANHELPYTLNFISEGADAVPIWSIDEWHVSR